MAPTHSDLEVVPTPIMNSSLEFAKARDEQDTYKEAQQIHDPRFGYVDDVGANQKTVLICGLSRKRFWIVAAVIVAIVLAAAIGGGVGGSLAGKHHNSSTASGSSVSAGAANGTIVSTSANSSMTASVTGAPTLTTRAIVTVTTAYASTILYPDCPSRYFALS